MLSRLERRPRQLEVRRTGCADIDEIDVVALDELPVRSECVRYAEAFGELARPIDDGIGDGDDAAAWVTEIAGNVRKAGPVAGAENSDADRQGTPLQWAGAGNFTDPNVTADINTRHT